MTLSNTPKILYISYDGIMEPLGQSQVLGYLKYLSRNFEIHLISFEKPNDWGNQDERIRIYEEITDSGIMWHPLLYHKNPSAVATTWDICCGSILGLYLTLRHKIQIVHARSYVPAVMALVIKKIAKTKFLFDMRGFWADERVDGGLWPKNGKLFELAKAFERRFLLSADHVISLTYSAVREMQNFPYLLKSMPPITVIPTCANLSVFTPSCIKKTKDHFTLGYVGSVGTWYLFDEAIACFKQLLEMQPNAHFLIVNRGEHIYIGERLDSLNVPRKSVTLITAAYDEMPKIMARMDAGIFFIKPAFSKKASVPTKLAEFLGCGVPCLSNVGVGDIVEILEGNKVGIALMHFDEAALRGAIKSLFELVQMPDIKHRCREVALQKFSLEDGAMAFSKVYTDITGVHNG